MPIYEYQCKKCKDITEIICRFEDTPTVSCASCGNKKTERVISECGWHLKGDGWYNPINPKKRARGGAGKKK